MLHEKSETEPTDVGLISSEAVQGLAEPLEQAEEYALLVPSNIQIWYISFSSNFSSDRSLLDLTPSGFLSCL